MGLFDRQVEELERFLAGQYKLGKIRELPLKPRPAWPVESTLVLEEDTAIELGHPQNGSLAFALWTKKSGKTRDRVWLSGPDLSELESKSIPFGQVVLVSGLVKDEYESYLSLRDAVSGTRLKGMMSRGLPSRQTVWCRVNKEALARGFSLTHLGAALVRNLKRLAWVSSAQVLFITSGREELEALRPIAESSAGIAGALVKMKEENDFDCDNCEYQEVCGQVKDLKKIRQALQQARG
jgi:CO dehydrogenase/acetyl-CoA synthase beta subunit